MVYKIGDDIVFNAKCRSHNRYGVEGKVIEILKDCGDDWYVDGNRVSQILRIRVFRPEAITEENYYSYEIESSKRKVRDDKINTLL